MLSHSLFIHIYQFSHLQFWRKILILGKILLRMHNSTPTIFLKVLILDAIKPILNCHIKLFIFAVVKQNKQTNKHLTSFVLFFFFYFLYHVKFFISCKAPGNSFLNFQLQYLQKQLISSWELYFFTCLNNSFFSKLKW